MATVPAEPLNTWWRFYTAGYVPYLPHPMVVIRGGTGN